MRARLMIPTLALIAASLVIAGPLNPPPGPITSTNKTLAEVEPRIAINSTNTPGNAFALFRITQPGSYYLTGNVTGEVGKHGIQIAASGVTIDLNGFDLKGVPDMGSFDGITTTQTALNDIEVRNGTVREWGDDGIDLGTLGARNSIVRNVRATGNADHGITVHIACSVIDCTAFANRSPGILTNTACTVERCTAYLNSGSGISAGAGCTITRCTAFDNTSNGILAGTGSTIAECTATNNDSIGIVANSGSTITGSTASDNFTDGISTGFSCTLNACTVTSNRGIGIVAATGSRISGSTARLNTLDGIRVSNECVVTANMCSTNGSSGDGAGIHATGSDNRIEGNSCTLADRGIDVDAAGNIIVTNTCSGNTLNWDITAGNFYGPIIDLTLLPTPPAVTGNSAADTLGSTHPNANFTY